MASVTVPIDLVVEDIKTGKVNFGDLEKSIKSQMSSIVKDINATLASVDTSKFNKELSGSMGKMTRNYQKMLADKAKVDQAMADAGKTSPEYKAQASQISAELKQAERDLADFKNNYGALIATGNPQITKVVQDMEARVAELRAKMPNPADFLGTASDAGIQRVINAYNQFIRSAGDAKNAKADFDQSMKDNKYTDEYAEKLKQLAQYEKDAQRLQGRADKLNNRPDGGSLTAWTQLKAEAGALEEKIAGVRHEMELLVRIGGAFRFGGDNGAEMDAIAQRTGNVVEQLEGIRSGSNGAAASFTAIGKACQSFASTAKSGIATVIKSLGNLISKLRTAHKNTDTLGKSLKRLWKNFMMFGLGFRSLYFMIKRLRTAAINTIKEMATQIPEVNTQVSSIMTSFNKMKGSFGTAFEPILASLARALAVVAAAAERAANAIARLFASFSGRGYIYKFTAANEDYAKSAAGAGGGADKLKKSLMGFDEINRLDDNSGGGGGGGADSIGDWEKEEFEPSDFMKKLMEAWRTADFTEIGEIIGKKLAGAFDKATDWLNNTYGPFVTKIAKSLATFINGFTGVKELPIAFGNMVGAAINNTAGAIKTFFDTTKWDQVGTFLADCIMESIRSVDWALLGSTLASYLRSMITLAWSFVAGLDFTEAGQKLTTAINSFLTDMGAVDESGLTGWQKLGQTIGNTLVGIGDFIITVLQGVDWQSVGQAVGECIGSIDWGAVIIDFGKIVWAFVTGLGSAFSSWAKTDPISAGLVALLGTAIAGADLVGGLMVAIPKIQKFIKMFEMFSGPIKMIGGIGLALAGAGIAITSFVDQFKNGFDTVKSILMIIGSVLAAVGLAIAGFVSWWAVLIAAIVAALAAAFLWVKTNWNEICEWLKTTWEAIKQFFADTWEKIKELWNSALEWISNLWTTVWTAVSNFFVTIWNGIVNWLNTAVANVKNAISTALNWIKSTWTTIWTSISQFFTNTWNGIKNIASSASNWVKTTVTNAGNAIKSGWNNAMTAVANWTSEKWNSIVGTVKGAINSVLGFVNRMISGVASGLNAVIGKINSLSFDIPDWVPAFGGSHFGLNIPTVSAPQIPLLAKGAVLPPNAPFLAMLGDQKSGTNVEAPLSTIEEAVALVMDDYIDGMMAGFQAVVDAINNKDMEVNIGDNAIGRAAARYNRKQKLVAGGAG